MSGFPIVDLVIGIIFIYFLLSVISSSGIEMILTVKKVRPRILQEWLLKIFDKEIIGAHGKPVQLGQAIMDHCSITALSDKKQAPSYIDAKNFTAALLEKISYDPDNPKSIATDLDQLIAAIQKTNSLSTEFQRVLLTYAYDARDTYKAVNDKTKSEVEIFRAKVDGWYNSTMDRLTDVLKKDYTRPFTIIVAIVSVLLLNADSVAISRYLYSNPEARASVAEQAYNVARDSFNVFNNRIGVIRSVKDSASVAELEAAYQAGVHNIKQAKAVLEEDIPLGWNPNVFKNSDGRFSWFMLLSKIAGLAATILAVIMGAPFWFDLLNKIANLRGAGPKPAPGNDGGKNTA